MSVLYALCLEILSYLTPLYLRFIYIFPFYLRFFIPCLDGEFMHMNRGYQIKHNTNQVRPPLGSYIPRPASGPDHH